MVSVEYTKAFRKAAEKMDLGLKQKVKKLLEKIADNPSIGKPMRFQRKGTRELYISPYRLAYSYDEQEDKLIFLEIYHKDEQ